MLDFMTLAAAGVLCAAQADAGQAQSTWVFFCDKGMDDAQQSEAVVQLAQTYSDRAVRRRAARRAAPGLFDERDLPVCPAYITEVLATGATLRVESRWLNAVSVSATPAQIRAIAASPDVDRLAPVRALAKCGVVPVRRGATIDAGELGLRDPYGLSAGQLNQIQIPALHSAGFTGAGIVIGVLDTGFRTTHVAFNDPTHGLNVVAEWDFLNDDPETDSELEDPIVTGPHGTAFSHDHGTYILGTLAAYRPNELIGGAYDADYILCKTEDFSDEYEAEEDFYVAGLEFIELHGGDVATSSLIYDDWYTYEDKDGQTAVTTIAVNVATANGLLCVTAAGNGGTTQDFPTLGCPADALDVLTIGAVNAAGVLTDFSSGGPTFDGRIKPELLAQGEETASIDPGSNTAYDFADGTSMSTPLAAAAAALLLDAHPSWGSAEVRAALLATASDFVANGVPDPQSHRGWGIIRAFAASQQPACDADIDGDGAVDLDDLLLVLGNFGLPADYEQGDVDGSGSVDLDDLLIVLGAFGGC